MCKNINIIVSEIMVSKFTDADEIAKFSSLYMDWWKNDGAFGALHKLTPARMLFIRQALSNFVNRDTEYSQTFAGLRILDVGCGGGLLAEPLKRLGADVTGLDASAEAIKAAKDHASVMGLDIDYRIGDLSILPDDSDQFDVVIASEVIEHISDSQSFIEATYKLISPGGKLIITTLNRSLLSLLGAKIFAEYILKIVPAGTHDWRKFITPSELNSMLIKASFTPEITRGISYSIREDEFQLAANPVVNYAVSALKS